MKKILLLCALIAVSPIYANNDATKPTYYSKFLKNKTFQALTGSALFLIVCLSAFQYKRKAPHRSFYAKIARWLQAKEDRAVMQFPDITDELAQLKLNKKFITIVMDADTEDEEKIKMTLIDYLLHLQVPDHIIEAAIDAGALAKGCSLAGPYFSRFQTIKFHYDRKRQEAQRQMLQDKIAQQKAQKALAHTEKMFAWFNAWDPTQNDFDLRSFMTTSPDQPKPLDFKHRGDMELTHSTMKVTIDQCAIELRMPKFVFELFLKLGWNPDNLIQMHKDIYTEIMNSDELDNLYPILSSASVEKNLNSQTLLNSSIDSRDTNSEESDDHNSRRERVKNILKLQQKNEKNPQTFEGIIVTKDPNHSETDSDFSDLPENIDLIDFSSSDGDQNINSDGFVSPKKNVFHSADEEAQKYMEAYKQLSENGGSDGSSDWSSGGEWVTPVNSDYDTPANNGIVTDTLDE